MTSKFEGTWIDPSGFHAVITGSDGTVEVGFTDAGRPGPFPGTEKDPKIAPAFIDVDFTDVGQKVRGTLQSNGQLIVWSNGTQWVKAAAETAGA